MKILTVITTIDFSQFTRRATIEAISKTVELLQAWYVNNGGDSNDLRDQFSGYRSEINRQLQLILEQYGG